MYEKILLAADGSENSLRASVEAIKIASMNSECKVDIIYVADFAKSKNEILHTQGKEALDFSRRQKLIPIQELLQAKNIPYTTNILRGEPGPTIIRYANEHAFELVVIGSRGLNALQEMVLGSVSHKVVKRVNCPVLIVK
ncbi:universal stress protein [Psychrobacillus soli]|uniref:Universal stress protein n=1 Tax=Psychrobacillus soli TaxID=1543965 RepID=A0A544TM31_9BACI|nr:universal stress protein [Psychrobacillus soli]TQR18489.1 universal stress protein [Psychrobacillus soli]